MSEQNKIWTLQEDSILLKLRDQLKIVKWSQVSRILEEQFNVKGRNGKKCRQRYQNHLNCQVKRQEWTSQEEKHLIQLHNQKGNRWVQIARQLQRTDNSVKNHYHSKLRKSLRKINKCIGDHLKMSFRPFKNNILSRIVQSAEEYACCEGVRDGKEQAKEAFILKNKIINHAQLSQLQLSCSEIEEIKILATQICNFNKGYKKNENSEIASKPASNKYKGKQIISLLYENTNQSDMRLSSRRQVSNTSLCEDYSDSTENRIVHHKKGSFSSSEENQKLSPQTWTSMNTFVNSQPLYFFNENIFSYQQYCSPIFQQQESSLLFSGKNSSFTFYHSQNEKTFQGSANSSMNRIDVDFPKNQSQGEINNNWSDNNSLHQSF